MPHVAAQIIEAMTSALTVAGIAYFIAVLVAVSLFERSRRAIHESFAPAMSILKPLKGMDPGMLDGFRSHCQQSYRGSYEIIFGVGSLDDPAVAAVEQLMVEFPDRKIELVVCPEQLGANGKVSALVQMLPRASHDFLVINDSDILVSAHYLERVAYQFYSPSAKRVGLVTTLYRGRSHGTLPSRLESLGIATDFQAGVLLSRWIEGGMRFGLGSTLAIRREALEAIGGLLPMIDHLADDYELGARVHAAGYDVALASEVVETRIPAYDWRSFMNHQLRWGRTVRDSRPGGYMGLIVTHGLAWGLLNVVASGASPLSIWLLGMSFFLRLSMAMGVGAGVLGDHEVLPWLWLLPLRDCIHLGVWVMGFGGNMIEWRGERFRLDHGKLHRL